MRPKTEHGRWLETHVWHAKRMRMIDRWGYKLVCFAATEPAAHTHADADGDLGSGAVQADRPNDKSVRACRAAMAHTVLAHDASYTGVLELSGTVSDITAVLTLLADPTGTRPGAQRYAQPARVHCPFESAD